MDESLFEEEQDRIEKSLNEAKRRELEEKYGAHFSRDESNLPPKVESDWLDYVMEFERQFENAKQIVILEVLGFPTFKTLDEIPPERLESELDSVLELLSEHNISLDCLAEVSDQDLYRFITTELVYEEIDDMKIDGMRHCFIYEEFHPNDEYDAKRAAEDFVQDLFERHEEFLVTNLSKDEMYDPQGHRITQEAAIDLIRSFYRRFAAFTSHKFECIGCTLEGDYVNASLQGEWLGLVAESMVPVSHKGVCELRMKKSEFGGYDVIQALIPGFVTQAEEKK